MSEQTYRAPTPAEQALWADLDAPVEADPLLEPNFGVDRLVRLLSPLVALGAGIKWVGKPWMRHKKKAAKALKDYPGLGSYEEHKRFAANAEKEDLRQQVERKLTGKVSLPSKYLDPERVESAMRGGLPAPTLDDMLKRVDDPDVAAKNVDITDPAVYRTFADPNDAPVHPQPPMRRTPEEVEDLARLEGVTKKFERGDLEYRPGDLIKFWGPGKEKLVGKIERVFVYPDGSVSYITRTNLGVAIGVNPDRVRKLLGRTMKKKGEK